MFWPFRKAIEKVLPDVRIVVDKFHVVASIDGAAQKVRVRYGRRQTVVGRDGGLARQDNPRFAPGIWQARWTFGKRQTQLTDTEQARAYLEWDRQRGCGDRRPLLLRW